jgi:hypothetical protein
VCSNLDRGSVVVADLAVGAMIVVILASAASAAGQFVDAAQSSREAARSAAVEIARSTDPLAALRRAQRLAPDDAEVEFEVADRTVVVRVRTRTDVLHPIVGSRRLLLTSEVSVPIAPYRSR